MWRRDKGLGYWLQRSGLGRSTVTGPRLPLVPRRLRLQLHTTISDLDAPISPLPPVRIASPLPAEACMVKEAQVDLRPALPDAASVGLAAQEGETGAADEVTLGVVSEVSTLELPHDRIAQVRSCALLPRARLNSPGIFLPAVRVRRLALCNTRQAKPARSGLRWLFPKPAAVRDHLREVRAMPCIRPAVDFSPDPGRLQSSFCHEAERIGKIPPGKSEVLAVFSMIPVELISRLRYEPERRLIVFTLAVAAESRQIRLHDLAVVRNRDSGYTCFVAHRTRCRIVTLW